MEQIDGYNRPALPLQLRGELLEQYSLAAPRIAEHQDAHTVWAVQATQDVGEFAAREGCLHADTR